MSRLYWTLPSRHPFPDYVIDFKHFYCHFLFKKYPCFLSVVILNHCQRFILQEQIWNGMILTLIEYGVSMSFSGMDSEFDWEKRYHRIFSPTSPTPACTLLDFNGNVLKTGARSRVHSGESACSLFSLLNLVGMWIYFSRKGDGLAWLAILSGVPNVMFVKYIGMCVVCHKTV